MVALPACRPTILDSSPAPTWQGAAEAGGHWPGGLYMRRKKATCDLSLRVFFADCCSCCWRCCCCGHPCRRRSCFRYDRTALAERKTGSSAATRRAFRFLKALSLQGRPGGRTCRRQTAPTAADRAWTPSVYDPPELVLPSHI